MAEQTPSLAADCIEPTLRGQSMRSAFESIFGQPATVGVRAPGRVDLMGSHTDYNDGFVLTLAIDREIWILARPRRDNQVRLASLNLAETGEFDVREPAATHLQGWGGYLQGVAVELQRAGHELTPCDLLVHGTVPVASGLSSSAALEAASATLFECLGDFVIEPVEKARLAQRAENDWVGVNCGILDQYSSILGEAGKALLLDCRRLTHRYAELPPGLGVVIGNTCAPRQLSESAYGERRAQCEAATAHFARLNPTIRALRDITEAEFERGVSKLDATAARRARFIIEENTRVSALAMALESDQRSAIRQLAAESFRGARDLYEICVPPMQAMADAMNNAPGIVGCRQAGAGFGGCLVAFVDNARLDEFCAATASAYEAASGLTAEIYPVKAARGAGRLPLG